MPTIRELEKGFDLDRYLKKFAVHKWGGDERSIDCPACGRKDKLWINVKKRIGFCYYCEQVLPTVLDIIIALEGVPYHEAVEALRDGSSVNVSGSLLDKFVAALAPEGEAEVEEPLKPLELPKGFTAYEDAEKVPTYFASRGISKEKAIQFGLGFCVKGFYFNRMIVPIVMHGQLFSYHARWMKKVPPEGVKKVLYPKGTKSNRLLFNFDTAKKCKRIVIVEDPFSAMAVGRSAVATFGTKLGAGQMALLLSTDADEYVVMWDRDARKKAAKLASKLSDLGLETRIATLEDERDPDELSPKALRVAIERASRSGLWEEARAIFGA